MCACLNSEKHGRPPNQGGSANKPPVSGLSDVKLLFSCGEPISKLQLSVLRTLNRVAGSLYCGLEPVQPQRPALPPPHHYPRLL